MNAPRELPELFAQVKSNAFENLDYLDRPFQPSALVLLVGTAGCTRKPHSLDVHQIIGFLERLQ